MSNLNELFNPTLNAPVTESSTNPIFFTPDPKQAAKNGGEAIYKAIVKFVPNYLSPSDSIVYKSRAYLTNVVTNESRTIDSRYSIGEKCPIRDMFFKLYKSNVQTDKDNAKKYFSCRDTYYSLVQIIEDKVHPENVGKILIWRYGIKIKRKIDAEIKPEFGEGINPFDVVNGRWFYVNASLMGGFTNLDESNFINTKADVKPSFRYYQDGKFVGYVDESNPDESQKLFEYLKANSPSLEEMKFKPWDDETTRFVDDVIRAFNDPVNYQRSLYNAQQAQVKAQAQGYNVSNLDTTIPYTSVPPTQTQPTQPSNNFMNDFMSSIDSDIKTNNDSQTKTSGSEDALDIDEILRGNTMY